MATRHEPGVPAGVLVVDKAPGPTSHDMVSLARRALGERRIGHCGTLDPMATGVLVLAVGTATRLAQYLASDEKQYDAAIRFGIVTDTYDVTGRVQRESDERPTREAVEGALARFRGVVQQTPPPFSAKKIDGQRAYALARREASVHLAPVAVETRALTLTAFDGTTAHLTMTVSAGFYVRSLAHDLGAALGMGAALASLRRTASGAFTLATAVPSDLVATASRASIVARMVPLEDLLPDRPSVCLSEADVVAVRHGRDVELTGVQSTEVQSAEVQSTGVQSTEVQSTKVQSTEVQSTEVQSTEVQSAEVQSAEVRGVQDVIRLIGPDGRLVALAVPGKVAGFLHPSVVLR